MIYEAHITFDDDPDKVELYVSQYDGWSFSEIEGDIELGKGIKSYATAHFADKKIAISDTIGMAHLFKDMGLKVARFKVEEIIYDCHWSY